MKTTQTAKALAIPTPPTVNVQPGLLTSRE